MNNNYYVLLRSLLIGSFFLLASAIDVFSQTAFGAAQTIGNTDMVVRVSDIGDVDNDGDLDFLSLSDSNNAIIYWVNDGNGNFIEQQTITDTIMGIESLRVYDIDSDNKNDIVITANNHQKIKCLKSGNNNNYTYIMMAEGVNQSFNDYLLTDINNDNKPDIICKYTNSHTIDVCLNQGNNVFTSPQLLITAPESNRQQLADDLDNDGDNDIITFLFTSDRLAIYSNNENGIFEQHQIINDTIECLTKIMVKDIDNDSDKDIIVASHDNNELFFYANNGNATFSDKQMIDDEAFTISTMDLADIDNDGNYDIVTAYKNTAMLYWYENDGNGTFSKHLIANNPTADYQYSRCSDINNDAYIDIVSCGAFNNYANWRENLTNSPYIAGQVFYDINQNGSLDIGETGIYNPNVSISPTAIATFNNVDGYYVYYIDQTNYSLSYLPPTGWELSTPSSYDITLNAGESSNNNHFGIYPIIDTTQMNVYKISNNYRCNDLARYDLYYTNTGTTTVSGMISFKAADLTPYLNSTTPPDSVAVDGTRFWNYYNLPPFQQKHLSIQLQMPNETFTGTAFIQTVDIVSHTNDNSSGFSENYIFTDTLRCSYDPNDKQVEPQGIFENHYTLMDKELIYTVRFQNTGNDTAYQVIIQDQLDDDLDWTTFRPIISRHPVQILRNDDGIVTFTFNNIMLPDSSTDATNSQGYIMYGIRPKTGLPNNTSINNTAAIYFDENSPIVTNTTVNTMVYELPTTSANYITSTNAPNILLHVDAAFEQLIVQYNNPPNSEIRYAIYNSKGQQIAQQSMTATIGSQQCFFNTATYPKGIYIVSIQDTNGTKNLKWIK
ncbi:MAG: T9SS type A sorting domain-containing protein [Chitinophagales bacterium]|nr:T9SS type A sorting domain-containing protein [Chitinophagales bacterium]